MTRTAQAKSLLFAPAPAEDFWPEVNAAARLRTPSQPPPLPSEPEDAEPTGGLDLVGAEEPQTSSTTTFAAGTTAPAEGDVRISIAELRELLLARIGDTRDDDGQRAPSASLAEPQAADPVAAKAPHRPVRLHLGLLLLLLAAAVIAGGVALVVVAQRTVRPVSPAAPAAATGQLSIVSDVPGAQVSIDGQDRGVTPLEVALDPGAHAVEVTSGGRRETMAVSIARGARDVFHVVLTSPDRLAVGALRVSTPIPGAGITLDGAYRGLTPMTFAQLEPGFHEVAVVQGRVTERHAVRVEQDRTTEISVAFATPAAAPPPPPVTSQASSGWIVVACPIPVEILENGDLVGSSHVARVMMASGSHVLEFVNTEVGYRARRTIDIVAGKTTRVPVELPQGALSVNAMPWAELWVDGSHIGETPLGNVPVRIGRHDVVFKHPQLGERRLQVLVRADTPARVSVDMSK